MWSRHPKFPPPHSPPPPPPTSTFLALIALQDRRPFYIKHFCYRIIQTILLSYANLFLFLKENEEINSYVNFFNFLTYCNFYRILF